MDIDQQQILLTRRKFETLLDCIKNTGLNTSLHAHEIVEQVCPLLETDSFLKHFAVDCLKLSSQKERLEHCDNLDCPLLGTDPINVAIRKRTPGVFNYNVDPISGLVSSQNEIIKKSSNKHISSLPKPDIQKAKPVKAEYVKSINNCIVPDIKKSHSDALVKIFSTEYKSILHSRTFRIPRYLDRQFIENNTGFRYLFIQSSDLPVPTDQFTIDLTGWAYVSPTLSNESLAISTSSNIQEVQFREPLFKTLSQEINSCLHPYQRYMELKRTFEEI